MAVNASDEIAQRYGNNTDGHEWLSETQGADVDGDEWTDGLEEAGVENTDQIDGDEVWANEWSVDQSDAEEYDDGTTAAAWAEGWGDAEEWNV